MNFVLFIYREPFKTIIQLIEHLKQSHHQEMFVETQTFANWKDFVSWKEQEQTMNKCWFVKHRGDRKTKAHIVSWFYCNRSGFFKTRGNGKRSLNSQGSSKIHDYCSAFVTTRTDLVTGEVVAEYCLRHRGHKRELCFNRMSSELRLEVVAKLAQGVSMTNILDSIRDSCVGPVKRDHLTSRKDLHNIKSQYNLNLIQKGSDDAKSVLFWVSEMKVAKFNSVLCYKSQGETSTSPGVEENDFLLGLQTEF